MLSLSLGIDDILEREEEKKFVQMFKERDDKNLLRMNLFFSCFFGGKKWKTNENHKIKYEEEEVNELKKFFPISTHLTKYIIISFVWE